MGGYTYLPTFQRVEQRLNFSKGRVHILPLSRGVSKSFKFSKGRVYYYTYPLSRGLNRDVSFLVGGCTQFLSFQRVLEQTQHFQREGP